MAECTPSRRTATYQAGVRKPTGRQCGLRALKSSQHELRGEAGDEFEHHQELTYRSISVRQGLGPAETATRHPHHGLPASPAGEGPFLCSVSPAGSWSQGRGRLSRLRGEGGWRAAGDGVSQRSELLMAESAPSPGAPNHDGNMKNTFQGSTSSPRDNILIMDSGQLISQFGME